MTQYTPLTSPATLPTSAFSEPIQETQELVHELEQRIEGEVRFDGYSRMLYSTDASQYQIQPLGVVIPRTADDVQAAVEIAARHRVPLLPRGGGSSLAGQCVGPGLVIRHDQIYGPHPGQWMRKPAPSLFKQASL